MSIIFDKSNNTPNIIFRFDINKQPSYDYDNIFFNTSNSFILINNRLQVNLVENNIEISDYYLDYFNEINNIINMNFINLVLDTNPVITIPDAKFKLDFTIVDYPIYIDLVYKSNEGIIFYKSNINL